MNFSRSIADLLDNTGSLNGFALSFTWAQRAQCLRAVLLAQLPGGALCTSPDKMG